MSSELHSTLDQRRIIANHLVKPIQEGKPELGWSGDPNLVLAFHTIEQRWELWFMGHSSKDDFIVARGPVGQDINEDAINMLIQRLVQGDTHRAGNSHVEQMERMIERNNALERRKHAEAVEKNAEVLDRFYHAVGATPTKVFT